MGKDLPPELSWSQVTKSDATRDTEMGQNKNKNMQSIAILTLTERPIGLRETKLRHYSFKIQLLCILTAY